MRRNQPKQGANFIGGELASRALACREMQRNDVVGRHRAKHFPSGADLVEVLAQVGLERIRVDGVELRERFIDPDAHIGNEGGELGGGHTSLALLKNRSRYPW